MNNSLRVTLWGGIITALLIACGKQSTAAPLTPAANPQSASVTEVVNHVEVQAAGAAASAPVAVGYALEIGGELTTGDASKARLDFSDGSILRVGPTSSFALKALTSTEGDPVKRLHLDIGVLWVSLTEGTLEAETPVGVASVRGSFAIIRYDPGDPNNPDDDLLVVDCLEGSCAILTNTGKVELGNLERIVLSHAGQLRLTLTGDDVQAFLRENPEGQRLIATLTAAPPATATPSSATTETSTPRPSASTTPTLTRVNTATAIILATPSATPRPSATPKPTTAVPLIGRHVVRPGETLFCISRAYDVLPSAIAQANRLSEPFFLIAGQILNIPAVRWFNVIPGPVCAPQFVSPYGSVLPPATGTPLPPLPTLTASPLLTPTATCEPGSFYDPFQKRCRPPDTAAPLITNTPTITFVPPPTNTPTPAPPTDTPTQTDTPLPDTLGPNITNPQAAPINVVGDGTAQCPPVNFQVMLVDPSGVNNANVVWNAFDSTSTLTGNGSLVMSLLSGTTFNGVWSVNFNVPIQQGGFLSWDVQAFDTLGNPSQVSTSPTWDINNLGTGACLP